MDLKIMNIFYRILLTFNATSLLVIIFFVQKGYSVDYLIPTLSSRVAHLHNIYSFIVYLMFPILLTGLSLWLCRFLGKDEFGKVHVETIEHANNSFLPSYLGYFFVALSIENCETLIVVYSVLFVFTFLSQALYFNPLFLVFGYEFYNVKTKSGSSVFLISKKNYKSPQDVANIKAYRINNYTFIERG